MAVRIMVGSALGALLGGVLASSFNVRAAPALENTKHLQPYSVLVTMLMEIQTLLGVEKCHTMVTRVDRLAGITQALEGMDMTEPVDGRVVNAAVRTAHKLRHAIKMSCSQLWQGAQDMDEVTQRSLERLFGGVEEHVTGMLANIDIVAEQLDK